MSAGNEEASPTCAVWHPSFEPASLPAPTVHKATEAGRAALAVLRAATHVGGEHEPMRRAQPVRRAWQDLPELYRRMVVAAAGLPREVVEVRDRELTEHQKVMMRSAISDMREWLASVAAL